MKRENRYLVVKLEDIEALPQHLKERLDTALQEIREYRRSKGKSETKYVVVAEDWPMYEQTWKAIENWVDDEESNVD